MLSTARLHPMTSALVLLALSTMTGCFNPPNVDDPLGDGSTGSGSVDGSSSADETGGCVGAEQDCNGQCVDVDQDPQHCGACNNPCASGEVCVAGSCAVECDPGELPCDGVCTNVELDPDHCGACEISCDPLQDCFEGQCIDAGCEFGEPCGQVCVDLDTDLDHCGACDSPCPAGGEGTATCTNGECGYDCPMGLGDCDPMLEGCESDLTSPVACGACDHPCEMGDTCMDPSCVGLRELIVNGDFSADLTSWVTQNNPMGSDDTSVVFEVIAGVLENGGSGGPNAKVAYQDFEVPPGGTLSGATFSLCLYQNPPSTLDPINVTTIQADPFDMSGDGLEQNALRVDLIDPASDVFTAPILYELMTPEMPVGASGACMSAMVNDPMLTTLLEANAGSSLRLRIGQVESTMPWQIEIDDVSLSVLVIY